MSFGFSISDFITLAQLTNRTYNGWKTACGDYADITGDLANLQALMARVEATAQAPNSVFVRDTRDIQHWKKLSKGLHSLLTELEGTLERYGSLGRSRRRNWDRIRFGCRNLDTLRQQLILKMTSLSAYLSVLGIISQDRIENETLPQLLRKVDDLASQMRKGDTSVVSLFTTYDDDDKTVWREFRRELIQSGFRSADIRKYSAALKTHLGRLQRSETPDDEDPEAGSLSYSSQRRSTSSKSPATSNKLVHHQPTGEWVSLSLASDNGYLETVKLLLENGADVTAPNKDGWTPLNSASGKGHLEVVKLLLEKGADITTPNKDGWTPLNSASLQGHLKVVKLLLEKGADVATPNKKGWTPLNSASGKGHLEVVKLLLEKGADITTPNEDGWTPLNSASLQGHLEVVKLLLEKGAKIATLNKDGWTPLNSACSQDHLEVVKLLLEKGADVATPNEYGWTPLYLASLQGHLEVVKLLLENGADITAPNEDGWTPLNSACCQGHLEVVKLLLEKGAQFTTPNKDGWTPLNSASNQGHLEVVKLLLEKGADVATPNKYGLTPLNSASTKGHLEIVKLLFEKQVRGG